MEPKDYINLCKEKLNETLSHYKNNEITEVDSFVMGMLNDVIVLDNPLLNADLIMHQVAESYYPNLTDAAHFILNLYGMKLSFDFLDTYLDIFFERLYEDELNVQISSSKIEQIKARLGSIDPKYIDIINKKEQEYNKDYVA